MYEINKMMRIEHMSIMTPFFFIKIKCNLKEFSFFWLCVKSPFRSVVRCVLLIFCLFILRKEQLFLSKSVINYLLRIVGQHALLRTPTFYTKPLFLNTHNILCTSHSQNIHLCSSSVRCIQDMLSSVHLRCRYNRPHIFRRYGTQHHIQFPLRIQDILSWYIFSKSYFFLKFFILLPYSCSVLLFSYIYYKSNREDNVNSRLVYALRICKWGR